MTCLAWFNLGKHDERNSISSPTHLSAEQHSRFVALAPPVTSSRVAATAMPFAGSGSQGAWALHQPRCEFIPGRVAIEARPPGRGMGNWRRRRWESWKKRCLGDTAWLGIAQPYGQGGYRGIRVSGATRPWVIVLRVVVPSSTASKYLTKTGRGPQVSCCRLLLAFRTRNQAMTITKVGGSVVQPTAYAIWQLATDAPNYYHK